MADLLYEVFLLKKRTSLFSFNLQLKHNVTKFAFLLSAGKISQFPPAPTFDDLGYSADLGLMRCTIIASLGILADRLAKLQDALAKVQKFKTYKKLIKAIGEETDYINGTDYEKIHP